jgi:hypothetical protein
VRRWDQYPHSPVLTLVCWLSPPAFS